MVYALSNVILLIRYSTSLNSNTADRNCLVTKLKHLLGKTMAHIKKHLETEDTVEVQLLAWHAYALGSILRPQGKHRGKEVIDTIHYSQTLSHELL